MQSTDSGADDPAACGGSGARPATYFDARFCNSGIRRLLQVHDANVITAVNANVLAWDMIMVLVNSTVYGGSGGTMATFSMAPTAIEIGIHEMGHTAFGLADEYEYWAGCAAARRATTTTRSRADPAERHHQQQPYDDQVGDLIPSTTPMPTTTNANCTTAIRRPTRSRRARSAPSRARTTTTAARTGRSTTAGCGHSASRSARYAAGSSTRP